MASKKQKRNRPSQNKPQKPEEKSTRWRKYVAGAGLAGVLVGGGLLYESLNDGANAPIPAARAPADASPLQKEVDELYLTLKKDIESAINDARRSDKKLYILLGENHDDAQSLLVELMVLSIAAKADPDGVGHTLFSELTKPELATLQKWLKEDRLSLNPDYSNGLKAAILAMTNGDLDYHIVPVDVRDKIMPNEEFQKKTEEEQHEIVEQTATWRNNAIAEEMVKSKRGGVGIFGSGHLKGLNEILGKNRNIIIKNIKAGILIDRGTDEERRAKYPTLYEGPEWANNEKNATPITLKHLSELAEDPTNLANLPEQSQRIILHRILGLVDHAVSNAKQNVRESR